MAHAGKRNMYFFYLALLTCDSPECVLRSSPFINKNFSFSRGQVEVIEEKSGMLLLQIIKCLRESDK